jgi:DNA-binding GntR family transcriptional regulator
MNVGTPVVREALISLQGQGFVRRVINTGTYVSSFTDEEIRQLYSLRVELEVLTLQWARQRVTALDLRELRRLVAEVVQASEQGNRRLFLERDYAFHRHCWALSGNNYLCDTLDRLMAPLFAFSAMAKVKETKPELALEHYELIRALQDLDDPEFTTVVRGTFSRFASRWLTAFHVQEPVSEANGARTPVQRRRKNPSRGLQSGR